MGSVLRQEPKRITVAEWDNEMMLFFARFNCGQFIVAQTPSQRGGFWNVDRKYRAMIEKVRDGVYVATCWEFHHKAPFREPLYERRGTLRDCIRLAARKLEDLRATAIWEKMDKEQRKSEAEDSRQTKDGTNGFVVAKEGVF